MGLALAAFTALHALPLFEARLVERCSWDDHRCSDGRSIHYEPWEWRAWGKGHGWAGDASARLAGTGKIMVGAWMMAGATAAVALAAVAVTMGSGPPDAEAARARRLRRWAGWGAAGLAWVGFAFAGAGMAEADDTLHRAMDLSGPPGGLGYAVVGFGASLGVVILLAGTVALGIGMRHAARAEAAHGA
ncbi:MAG: hypothetical protein QOD77_611 [Thermoplasmata archaeon]|jgi:hypothetical protein|nr:hypothetical protein [Thermoplasmata archaeon]